MVLTALTSAASGNVTETGSQFIQAAAANYLQSLGAQEVKQIADSQLDSSSHPTNASEITRAALQALVGCAGATAREQDCGAGATGAATSVVLNNLAESWAGAPVSNLDAQQREAQESLGMSLVAGIAAMAESSNVATMANAARIETENNALSRIRVGMLRYDENKKTTVGVAEVYVEGENRPRLVPVTSGRRTKGSSCKEC